MSKANPNRPWFVTKKLAVAWQPYVDKVIRKLVKAGSTSVEAVEQALDLRDEKIKDGKKPPKKKKR
jgi:hypothetical protein